MLKVEVDVSEVPQNEEDDVTAIILGFTTSLQYFTGITYKITSGSEVVEARSLGRNE